MNGETFDQIFERQVKQSREILVDKAKQYANDEDRLHNFRVAAVLNGETEEQALWGMLSKHLVSVSDMVQKDDFYPSEVWDEKIGDSINYLILLRAQVFETDDERTSDSTISVNETRDTLGLPPVIHQTIVTPPTSSSIDERYDPLS